MIPNPTQGPRSSRRHLFLFAIVLSLVLLDTAHAQSAPTLIPFQARLTNQLGEAYGSGQYTLTFNLYDQAVGGSTVWTERHEKVGIVNGMVNVFLGSIASFPQWQPASNPQIALFTGTKYLGITVDADGNAATADPEMVPRTMLVNAFHAQNASNLAGYNWSAILQSGSNNPQSGFIRADKLNPASITNAQITPLTINTASIANNAITSGKLAAGAVDSSSLADNSILAADLAAAVRESLVPPGTILPFGGSSAPAGFLLCDGTSYSRTGAYANLFTAVSTNFGTINGTSFNVPDLRGLFLRGVDSSPLNRDPDKASRTPMATGGAAGNAVGSVQSDMFASHRHNTNKSAWSGVGGTIGSGNTTAGADVFTDYVGGNETRPKNAYVNYIIKY